MDLHCTTAAVNAVGEPEREGFLRTKAKPFPKLVEQCSFFVPNFHNLHRGSTTRAVKRVIAKGKGNRITPLVKGTEIGMFLLGNGVNKSVFKRMVFGIKAVITDHLEMLFRNMPDEHFDEIHNGDSLCDAPVVFVPVVMEGDSVTIVSIDPG